MTFRSFISLYILFSVLAESTLGVLHPVFYVESGWENQTHAGYIGHFKIPLTEEMPSWWIGLIFPVAIPDFRVWQGTHFKSSNDLKIHYFRQTRWNGHQYPGMVMDQRYMAEFEREPGVDYLENPGPRPLIVFRHKVYEPSSTEIVEHRMQVYQLSNYRRNLPPNFETFPVLSVTTPAPSTVSTTAARTAGPNAGIFWWVRTLSPPLTTTIESTTTTTTIQSPTTTTPHRLVIPCQSSLRLRRLRCSRQGRQPGQCYLPQCSTIYPQRFLPAQCWRVKGLCWCVDPFNGLRTDRLFVRLREVRTLSCLAGPSTTTVAAPTSPGSANPSIGVTPMQRPPFAPRNNYDYNLVIHKSLLFFEAQRSGDIGLNGRVRWRFSAHTSDGSDCGADLSGGYYVSGDYVKYGFPTASAMTMLAWGYLEFRDAYDTTGETHFLKDALKWGTDYFIKAHISKYKLVGQVGLSDLENSFWMRPQDMRVHRPCYNITDRKPGSDLAAETAAAMAATAKVFMLNNNSSSDVYIQTLIQHARDLYDFSKTFRGMYSYSIRPAVDHYPSNGYTDEIVWAALWLYEATGERRYLAEAGQFYEEFGLSEAQTEVSWDIKTTPVQLLLAKYAYISGATSDAEAYLSPVTQFCGHSLSVEESIYTPQGLLYINEWGTTRYACNAAFVCLVASKLTELDPNLKRTYRKFAEDQIDYILGKSGRSYIVGYGRNFPARPHHRSSSCSLAGACGWDSYHSNFSNPQLLNGAMVGGPDSLDRWTDDRTNYRSNGVSIDYNAGMQGAVAGLRHFQMEYNAWLRYERGNSGK